MEHYYNPLKKMEYFGYTKELFYDKAGNRTHIKTSGGAVQELEYDACGNIMGVVDGNRTRTQYRLNTQQMKTAEKGEKSNGKLSIERK